MLKLTHNNKFILNGVEERVISQPNDRSGEVCITMGGKREFSSYIGVADFEIMTGYAIHGLEPSSSVSESDLLISAKAMLKKLDMNIGETNERILLSGTIKFTTSQNSTMGASFSLSKNNDQNYRISIRKTLYSRGMSSYEVSGKNLEILLNDIQPKLEGYVSTRVQILSAIEESDGVRRISEDGFNRLFINESVEDYFKQQEMPAGIVINQKDRYQIFTSYLSSSGNRIMNYTTKDYANLKNASKALAELGYEQNGKRINNFDTKEFEEGIRAHMRNHTQISWTDDTIGEFSTDDGFINISGIYLEYDEKFGCQWFYDLKFTDDKTGKSITKTEQVMPLDHGSHNHAVTIVSFSRQCADGILNESISFDIDTRTLEEKIQFHKDRYDKHLHMKNHHQQYVDNSNPHWAENAKNGIQKINPIIEHHLQKMRDLAIEIKKEYRDNISTNFQP